jgi:hypothetical protein
MLTRAARAAARARAALPAGCRALSAGEFPGDAATTVRAHGCSAKAHASALTTLAAPARSPAQSYLRNLDNGAEVYLVGTAHVSRKSADEARRQRWPLARGAH